MQPDLKVQWTTGDIMPPQLIDILHDSTTDKHLETGSAVANEDVEEDPIPAPDHNNTNYTADTIE